jgi:uncharacterized protein
MTYRELSSTPRTRLQRGRDRGRTDRSALYAVLDAGMICHLGVPVDGTPRVIPTAYGYDRDNLYLHGSTGSRSMLAGVVQDVCVTVTRLDGIVLGRSVFHHSVNYRSAMIYGMPRRVTDEADKLAGLRTIIEQLAPGQWDTARRPSRKELAATEMLALSLDEASVKIRTGPPVDEPEDYALDVWAGELPVHRVFASPITDPRVPPDIPVPTHVSERSRQVTPL